MSRVSIVLSMMLLTSAAGQTAWGVEAGASSGTTGNDRHDAFQWTRVNGTHAELIERFGTDVESIDYGRFQWAKLPVSAIPRNTEGAGDALKALDGNPFVLDLGGQRFDPLDLPPAWTDRAGGSGEDYVPTWHLVQFKGPIKRDWLRAMSEAGLEPVQYIHPFTYVVWGERAILREFDRFTSVRWAGDYMPKYGVQPQYHDSGDTLSRPTMVLVRTDVAEGLDSALPAVRGGLIRTITRINRFLSVVYMGLPRSGYMDMASIPGVYAVQHILPEAATRSELSGQSIVGAYDDLGIVVPGYLDWLDDLGHDGSGVVAAIVDELGFRQTHEDLAGNNRTCIATPGISSCSSPAAANGHATHVAGAVAGTGATGSLDADGFLRGLGVAPGATLVSQQYNPFLTFAGGEGGMVAEGMLKIFRDSVESGAVIANNSWGPTGSPQGYDIPTLQVDMIARDANPDTPEAEPLLPVWSIMNGRGDRPTGPCAPSSLGSPDEAKNLFAVGATYLLDNAGEQMGRLFDIAHVSGHGNACDGRRVPHIVAPGCNTDSTVGSSDTAHSHGGNGDAGGLPNGFCGTSMASPNVTGASALFIERYRELHEGRTPSPALVKAAFTAAATDLAGHLDADGRAMGHRPDRFQGYGRIDLAAAVDPQDAIVYVDQSHVLTDTGQEWQRTITAADPQRPMRIMLAWTDAHGHGLGGTTPAWVNDLDLLVEASGETYWGNAVGEDGGSSADGDPDGMNNLEGVFLSPEQHGGAIRLSVLAANIAADALHPFMPQTDAPAQDFALACYNCIEGEAPAPTSADLWVTLVNAPSQVDAGQAFEFDASISNAGPDAVVRSHLTLVFPNEIVPVSVTLDPAGEDEWSCAVDVAVECRLLVPLASTADSPLVRISARVAADAPSGVAGITGVVSSGNNVDANDANDSHSIEIGIVGKPDPIFVDGFECGEDC